MQGGTEGVEEEAVTELDAVGVPGIVAAWKAIVRVTMAVLVRSAGD